MREIVEMDIMAAIVRKIMKSSASLRKWRHGLIIDFDLYD